MWRRQVRVLQQQGYEPVAPDLPGFGAEPAASKPYAIVERVAPLLPACLVGNSFGGLVALETALAHAESVARLVLVDPALRGHDWSTEIEKYWEREEELLAQERFDDATQLTLATFVSPDAHDTIRPMQRRAYELKAAAADPLWPPAQPLSALRPPTLVLVGEHDLSDFHEIGLRIAREAPDARMEVVPGAMHVPSLETPAAFDRLLLDFLAAA